MNPVLKRRINKALFSLPPAFMLDKLFSMWYSGIGSIFFFHRIVEDHGSSRLNGVKWLECPQSALARLIEYFLENNYDIISLDQLAERLQGRKSGRKFVVFTFDDGYADNLNIAYPIFKKYSLPFAIYVSTGFPENTAVLWWYIVEHLIMNHEKISFNYKNRQFVFDVNTPLLKEQAYVSISDLFFGADNDAQLELVSSICEPYDIDPKAYSGDLPLTWEQLKKIASDEMVTIGAHTHNHYPLASLSEQDAINEIKKSKDLLELNLGKKVEHFAYPFGKNTHAGRREFDMARELGFKTAVTTRIGNIFPAHADYMLCLPRNMMFGDFDIVPQAKVYLSGMISALKYKFNRVVTE